MHFVYITNQIDSAGIKIVLYEAVFHPSVMEQAQTDEDYKEQLIELGLGCVCSD